MLKIKTLVNGEQTDGLPIHLISFSVTQRRVSDMWCVLEASAPGTVDNGRAAGRLAFLLACLGFEEVPGGWGWRGGGWGGGDKGEGAAREAGWMDGWTGLIGPVQRARLVGADGHDAIGLAGCGLRFATVGRAGRGGLGAKEATKKTEAKGEGEQTKRYTYEIRAGGEVEPGR